MLRLTTCGRTAVALLVLASATASGQPALVGDWEGTLEVPGGGSLPIVFHITAAGVTLAGTLTRPEGDEPVPGVVLISGSGPQNRDEALMGHRPFLVLADHLTRQGVAVLRLDDRGVGESAVRFVVLLAAPGVDGKALLGAQNDRIAAASGAPPAAAAANRSLQLALFEILETETDLETARTKMRTLLVDALSAAGLPEAQVAAQADAQLAQLTTPWLRHFLRYDPAPALRALEVPVLALNGTKDTQVPSDQNLPALRQALDEGGNDDVEVHELDGLNHLFQTAGTGAPAEYASIEETFAPSALDILSTWILERAGSAPR